MPIAPFPAATAQLAPSPRHLLGLDQRRQPAGNAPAAVLDTAVGDDPALVGGDPLQHAAAKQVRCLPLRSSAGTAEGGQLVGPVDAVGQRFHGGPGRLETGTAQVQSAVTSLAVKNPESPEADVPTIVVAPVATRTVVDLAGTPPRKSVFEQQVPAFTPDVASPAPQLLGQQLLGQRSHRRRVTPSAPHLRRSLASPRLWQRTVARKRFHSSHRPPHARTNEHTMANENWRASSLSVLAHPVSRAIANAVTRQGSSTPAR